MSPRKKKQKTQHSKPTGSLSQAEIWDDSALIQSWNDALAEYDYYHSIHARGEDVEEILRKAEAGELGYEEDERQVNGGWQPVDQEVKRADAVMRLDNGATEAHGGGGGDDDEDGEIVEDQPSAEAHELPSLQSVPKTAKHTLESGTDDLVEQPQELERPPAAAATHERHVGTVDAPIVGSSLPPANVHNNGTSHPEAASPQAPPPDQTLENIKMAYYWAGYYSGLYDGQRQAQSQAQSHAPG